MSKGKLIVIPGLGDRVKLTELMARQLNMDFEVIRMSWNDRSDFDSKLKKIIQKIDAATKEGRTVIGLGISAGGSAILNAFVERQENMIKVINVCGRLRAGEDVFTTLDEASKSSPSFRQSVLMFERNENKLSLEARSRVLTIRPLIDPVVPGSTVTVEGAVNAQIISLGHVLSIALAMTLYKGKIEDFLDN